MNYPTSILIMVTIVLTIALAIIKFSPPEPGASPAQDGPALTNFSSPSSEATPVRDTSAGVSLLERLPTQVDVQRELVRRGYKIKVDGVIGKASREAWDAETNNQYALEL